MEIYNIYIRIENDTYATTEPIFLRRETSYRKRNNHFLTKRKNFQKQT